MKFYAREMDFCESMRDVIIPFQAIINFKHLIKCSAIHNAQLPPLLTVDIGEDSLASFADTKGRGSRREIADRIRTKVLRVREKWR